jgi:hypothetical protein
VILTYDEIVALTGRRRKDAQLRVLRFMGIEHRVRPDGTVAVLRAHVEHELGGDARDKVKKEIEPDWSAL